MKAELEPQDIESIAQRVVELLSTTIAKNAEQGTDDNLLTTDEVAEVLKVKKAQIYAWVNESKYKDDGIPFLKAGKFLRFSHKEVLKWMQNGRRSVE